ncbi:hypothetical protein [Mycobacterium parmense]|uniref:Uncharacterized protein n=1 Tax=Mycobacterium parmense TaxID=185642 RepID=A0A7I7YLX4_9MYCO|nr:hypothetical protein [Mycobacterium parmense]MCV7349278.1 hypothetical protein [Mycobacterium parmense]ORW57235.1 hypothetical protein AWC20_14050 [Mycobacterium parmense]BBZ42836.1 hypothetical protein MPRM_01170 [Mycobacterium parmense]
MPTIWTYLRATAVVVGSSAALLTGGIAHADPAPPVPDVSSIPQQLIASAANAPQILQNLATALGATPPAAPATPGISFPGVPAAGATSPVSSPAGLPSIPGLTPPAASTPAAPAASPSGIPGLIQGLTQQPAAAPAAPTGPAASSLPGLPAVPGLSTPAAPATPPTPQLPQAQVNMPALPSGLGANVPPKLTLPQDLTALATGQAPGTPAAPAAPANPAAPTPSSGLLAALP